MSSVDTLRCTLGRCQIKWWAAGSNDFSESILDNTIESQKCLVVGAVVVNLSFASCVNGVFAQSLEGADKIAFSTMQIDQKYLKVSNATVELT